MYTFSEYDVYEFIFENDKVGAIMHEFHFIQRDFEMT